MTDDNRLTSAQSPQSGDVAQSETQPIQQPRTTTQTAAEHQLVMYSTTVSDTGYVRHNNQDSSFAGHHLAAVCDGMGGHAGGDTASTIAIRSLAHIEMDDASRSVESVATMMQRSIYAAHDAIVGQATQNPKLAGMGTTVTAISLVKNTWILAHIGDSRAYLLRDGRLIRVTKDHSYVQHLIDTGRISEAEGKNHPKRNVVMRVLGDFDIDPTPDISIRSAAPADRWLLCSDGLCGVLEDATIEEQLRDVADPEQCAQLLVSMALRAGSTDNVTAVIADAVTPLGIHRESEHNEDSVLLLGGAVVQSLQSIAESLQAHVMQAPELVEAANPAQRASQLAKSIQADVNHAVPMVAAPTAVADAHEETDTPITGEIPVVHKSDGTVSRDPHDPEVADAIRDQQRETVRQKRKIHFRARTIIAVIMLIVAIGATVAGALGWRWSQQQYYVGQADGVVTIYQGVPTDVFGLRLSHEVKKTTITVKNLPSSWQEQLEKGIIADSYDDAIEHTEQIRDEAQKMRKSQNTQNKSSDTSTSDGSGQFGGTEQSDDKKSESDTAKEPQA